MTTHESKSYIYQFKEMKSKEKEALDKAKAALRTTQVSRQRRPRVGIFRR